MDEVGVAGEEQEEGAEIAKTKQEDIIENGNVCSNLLYRVTILNKHA